MGGPRVAGLGRSRIVIDGPEEIAIVEARLVPTPEGQRGGQEFTIQVVGSREPTATDVEQLVLAMDEPTDASLCAHEVQLETPAGEVNVEVAPSDADPPPRRVSPYAEGL